MVLGAAWTDQRIELLKILWPQGLSASQIASELGGGLSRNAVIGKVHRLGLPGRVRHHQLQAPRRSPNRRVAWTPRPAVQKAAASTALLVAPEPEPPAVPDLPDAEIPLEQRRTLQQLDEDTCRWPVGDPATPDFFFCGARPGEGVYCPHHSRIAYNGIPTRQRADPPPRRNY